MNLFSFYLEFTYLANSSNSGVKQIFMDFEANGLQNKIFPALTLEIPIMLKKQNITPNFILISISIFVYILEGRRIYSMNPSIFDISTEDR